MEYRKEFFLRQQTFATLFAVSNKLQITGDEYLRSLTSRQLMTMIAIIHLPKSEASITAIAKKISTTKQNAKQIIAVIERKGYVFTKQSEIDKRAYNIEITQSGHEVLKNSYARGMTFFEEVFKGFTLDEMEIFWGYLKRLYRFDGEVMDGFEDIATND